MTNGNLTGTKLDWLTAEFVSDIESLRRSTLRRTLCCISCNDVTAQCSFCMIHQCYLCMHEDNVLGALYRMFVWLFLWAEFVRLCIIHISALYTVSVYVCWHFKDNIEWVQKSKNGTWISLPDGEIILTSTFWFLFDEQGCLG